MKKKHIYLLVKLLVELNNKTVIALITLDVVYFDQLLGAEHPKSWSKSSFLCKKAEKMRKKQEICTKIYQKTHFFEFAPKRWSRVLFPKNSIFHLSGVKM